ncbi:hypothetical protein H8E07_09675, partial [bacterium]|nr:hypothetical protein [bacterium]
VLEIGTIVAAVTGGVALEVGAGVVALLHACDGVGGALAAHDQNRAGEVES